MNGVCDLFCWTALHSVNAKETYDRGTIWINKTFCFSRLLLTGESHNLEQISRERRIARDSTSIPSKSLPPSLLLTSVVTVGPILQT